MNRDGLGIRIFSGLECDIRRDGAMDLAEDALAELDIVVGSVHSHMNLEAAEMTDRLMRALESPNLRVLGHPTGRMLLQSRSVSLRFRTRGGGGGAAQRLSGNQWQPRAAGSGRRAGPDREGPGREVRHFHGRAPYQTSGNQHAVRRDHGAARLAGGGGRVEHTASWTIRTSDPKIMKLISSKEKYKYDLFRSPKMHAVDPDGFEIQRAIVHHSGSAVMMAVDDRKRILLVRQYRLPARQYLWELPAGRLDEGESPLKAAKRELEEETGIARRIGRSS